MVGLRGHYFVLHLFKMSRSVFAQNAAHTVGLLLCQMKCGGWACKLLGAAVEIAVQLNELFCLLGEGHIFKKFFKLIFCHNGFLSATGHIKNLHTLTHTKSFGQAFSKACGVEGQLSC